jgi:two-component system, response regulator FlrC
MPSPAPHTPTDTPAPGTQTLGPEWYQVAPGEMGACAPLQTPGLVGRTIAEVERDMIIGTLAHCHGNRTHAANMLGISIRTIRNKINEYKGEGLDVPASTMGGS